MPRIPRAFILSLATLCAAGASLGATYTASNGVVSAIPTEDGFDIGIVSERIEATAFYEVGVLGQNVKVANIESGHVWNGHEALVQMPDKNYFSGLGALGDYSDHATAVGGIIAGLGPEVEGGYSYVSLGIAPFAELYSGAIATQTYDDGTFEFTDASLYTAYQHYFGQVDVINSSWGGKTPAANDTLAVMLDGFCRQNTKTTFVVATGNSGPGPNEVGTPATGYNNISVGATGNPHAFDELAYFSSGGPGDFYNPDTGETISGVRAQVDIVAPGSYVAGPYYDAEDTSTTDLYTIADGTSFAAPQVAGAVALLNSVSYELETRADPNWSDNARDARVIKAVLMASATQLGGWDNGQQTQNGVSFTFSSGGMTWVQSHDNVSVTTQSLDWYQGAGQLNLGQALDVYLGYSGFWVLDSIAQDSMGNEIHIELTADQTIAVCLTWFADRSVAEDAQITIVGDEDQTDYAVSDNALANLDLELWLLGEDGTSLPVAVSRSIYNSVEYIVFEIEQDGIYAIRVTHNGMVYGQYSAEEFYGLAWSVIPEPSAAALIVCLLVAATLTRRRR